VFTKITGSVFVATRLISSLSAVAVTIVLSLVVREETGGRVLSVGAVPVAFFALNEIARRTAFQANVDMLGLLFGTAALYWYLSRSGRRRLVGVIVLCFLALYTKHSLIAFPGAIFIAYLWEGEYRTAALFAGILSGVGFGVLLVLNLLTDGLFWFHVVAANSEIPYRLSDLVMKNYEQVFKPNMPIIAAGTAAVLVGYRHLPKVLVAYLPLSALTLLALGREGANANFFLVPLIGLVLATGILFSVAGGSERFRAILRRGADLEHRTFVFIAVLLIAQTGADIGQPFTPKDSAEEIDRIVANAEGPILSEDLVVLAKYDHPFIYQTSIMQKLTRTGHWNDSVIRRSISNQRFEYITMHSSVDGWTTGRFTAEQRSLIEENYRLRNQTGQYWVYVPNSS